MLISYICFYYLMLEFVIYANGLSKNDFYIFL
jgi:hypothetical protein